jgi:hypothetical protein
MGIRGCEYVSFQNKYEGRANFYRSQPPVTRDCRFMDCMPRLSAPGSSVLRPLGAHLIPAELRAAKISCFEVLKCTYNYHQQRLT